MKGERLFGFGVDNREEGTQNPDDIYLRVTDEPVLGYHFASPDVLRKDTEPGFYGIMAGTGAFGSVPVHLECAQELPFRIFVIGFFLCQMVVHSFLCNDGLISDGKKMFSPAMHSKLNVISCILQI